MTTIEKWKLTSAERAALVAMGVSPDLFELACHRRPNWLNELTSGQKNE